MKNILLSSGRKVAEGQPYRLMSGETIVGYEHTDEKGAITDIPPESLNDHLEKEGIQWGDAVKWVASRLGVKQCAPCRARQEILNNASNLGWTETIRQIKSTFKS